MKEKFDVSTWYRKDVFEFFRGMNHPFYEVTFPLDITYFKQYVRQQGISLYFSLCYQCADIMSSIEEFLLKFDGDEVVKYDRLHPDCIDINPNAQRYHMARLAVRDGESMEDFVRRTWPQSKVQTEFSGAVPSEIERDQRIFFTCLPWLPITSMNSVPPDNKYDSIPRVTFGAYKAKDGRTVIPCALLVNHCFVDGAASGRFYEKLQARLDSYKDLI